MKKELNIFLTALMFYTRIPLPWPVKHSQEALDESSRYFPLIGWIVGAAAAAVFYFSYLILPLSVSILLSMGATILLTGAFHEDGFADFCDGFGAGWNKEQILNIMKDSRIGTYGAAGLVFVLLAKFFLLRDMQPFILPLVLFSGHSISRFAVSIFRYTHDYVRDNDDAKAKPMAKAMSGHNLVISALFGILPLALFGSGVIFALLVPVILAERIFSGYVVSRIGGYTGDCLGATQQVCELTFYLGFILLWTFI